MKINLSEVVSVYSGVNGRCCCGCSGKHTYAESARGRGKELRGYDINEEEISSAVVARHVHAIERSGAAVRQDNYVEAVVGRRVYIAYLKG